MNIPSNPVSLDLINSLRIQTLAKYDIKYKGYLANHLNHALYAYYHLGGIIHSQLYNVIHPEKIAASPERIQAFSDNYVKKLEPIRSSTSSINEDNWRNTIGVQEAYGDYLKFFDEQISKFSMDGVLDKYFPELMTHSLGAALHPLICIGYGLGNSDPGVLAQGLAYSCIAPLYGAKAVLDRLEAEDILNKREFKNGSKTGTSRLGNFTQFHESIPVVQLLEQIPSLGLPKLSKELGSFHLKCEHVLEAYGELLVNLLQQWDLSEAGMGLHSKLNGLTEASILGFACAYEKQIDFFLVHGLTANHAVRMIYPHLQTDELKRKLLQVNLLGLLMTYVVQGNPPISVKNVGTYGEEREGKDIPDWDEIASTAIASDEEHVVKVVHALIAYLKDLKELTSREELFSEEFIKMCSFKMVDRVKTADDFFFGSNKT